MHLGAPVAVAAALILLQAPIAAAEPLAPQPNTPCTSDASGALTLSVDSGAALRCAEGRWQPVTDVYPFSDSWVSPGRSMTLRGGARQNPELNPGEWIATPLTAGDRCRAEQQSITYGRVDGPPRIDEGAVGMPLTLEIIPRLLDIDMTGNCLWRRTGD